jgi:hypothetical protein
MRVIGSYAGIPVTHITAFSIALSLQKERFLRLHRRQELGQFPSGDFKFLRMALMPPA